MPHAAFSATLFRKIKMSKRETYGKEEFAVKGELPLESSLIDFLEEAKRELELASVETAKNNTTDYVAMSKVLASMLVKARESVENEAVLFSDAMNLAMGDASGSLYRLKSITETVSSQSAFIKTSLNTIQTKTVEIEKLTLSIDNLVNSMCRFKSLVDDGTFEKAAKAACAIGE